MGISKTILKNTLFILLIAFIIRIIPIMLGTEQQDDMMLYKYQTYPVLYHLNIYKVTHRVFPYSPISMFIPALCMILSNFLKVPFHIIMKMPALFGDVFITVSIYLVMLKRKEEYAFGWALLYALNPLSILISSFHGNIMSIPTLFTFLAYSVLLLGIEANYRLSALLLGIAVGLRGYPILLVPLFLIQLSLSSQKKIEYLTYCLLPVIISFIPFLILDYRSVIREVFGYSGFTDYGIIALIRAALSFKYNVLYYGLPNNLHISLLNISKSLFILFYFIILFLYRKRKLIHSIVLVFLGFYFIYGGVASQYLIWLLPFAFLMKDRFLYVYLISASAALINFYLLYHPKIIFGKFDTIIFPLNKLLLAELISMFIFWLICGIWILSIIRKNKAEDSLLLL